MIVYVVFLCALHCAEKTNWESQFTFVIYHWYNTNLWFGRFEVIGGDMSCLLIAAFHIQCELNSAVGAEVSAGAIP